MTQKEQIALVIDTAHAHGVVAALGQDKIYAQELLREKMSHAKNIASMIISVEAQLTAQNKTISAVMVGLGPGSFIGLRIALATALGFAFGRSLPIMGFCSHKALALSVERDGIIYIAMKASGDWCYLSSYKKAGDELLTIKEPTELKKNEIYDLLENGSLLLSDVILDEEDLKKKAIELVLTNGPDVLGVMKTVRVFLNNVLDQSDFIKPNYVRAPNVTINKKMNFTY